MADPNVSGQRMLSGLKPLILLVGVAAAVAAGVGVMLWSVGPTYSLLYANLSGEDASQITQALDSARILYKLEDGGQSISVPAEQLAAARLKLAAQGLPESGGGVNAMTKDPGFGVSAFMESARYQHALETELARTIASLQNVQGARVHLAMAGSPPSSAIAGRARPRCSCRSRRAVVSMTSRCRPSPIWSLPAFRKCRPRRSPWWTRRGDCCPRPMATATRPCATRCSSSRIGSKNPMRSASRRCSRRWWVRGACARRSWRRWTWPPPSRPASSTTRKARWCAANPWPRRPRRMAPPAPAVCREP